jgi:hypothetical protein
MESARKLRHCYWLSSWSIKTLDTPFIGILSVYSQALR